MHRWSIVKRLLLLALALCAPGHLARAEESDAFVRQMNIGTANLEIKDSAAAIAAFTEATKLKPDSAPALRNLARAFLLARDHEAALSTLAKAEKLDGESPATVYLTGLCHVRLSKFAEAQPHMEKAVRLDPNVAALRFQLAGVYQALGNEEKAAEQLLETVRLDPLHASAHYRLSTFARKAGNKEEFQRRQEEFLRLRKIFGDDSRSAEALETCRYTIAESAVPLASAKPTVPPLLDMRFADVTDQVFPDLATRDVMAVAVLDVATDGRPTMIAVGSDGTMTLLTLSADGVARAKPTGVRLPGDRRTITLRVGDFQDDVPEGQTYDPAVHIRNDVLVLTSGGLLLFKRTGADSFEDVTKAAGLDGLNASAAAWVDFEHDGDLDLLVAGPRELGMWQNNGDGSFREVARSIGIPEGIRATGLAVVDLSSNVAVDLIVTRGAEPTLVLENQRTGRFAPIPEPPGPWPSAKFVTVNDLDNDGQMDCVLTTGDEVTVLYGGRAERHRLELKEVDPAGTYLVDADNDGRLDIFVMGAVRNSTDRGAVRIFRNVASADFPDISKLLALDGLTLPPIRDALAADFDLDADTDLLLLDHGGKLHYVRNNGAHVAGQLRVRLVPLKTNPSGYGTRVELHDADYRVIREITSGPIEIGLQGHRSPDSLRVVWTNGVVDHTIKPSVTSAPLTIAEKNVATGSCPFLYAWDGSRYRFVTDVLGNSPVGLPLTRDVELPADPDELVAIGPAETFPPRDGAYVVQVTSEFREVLYLDQVALLAVDHAADIEVHPTDKVMFPPFPPSVVWALANPSRLQSALSDDGIDRTQALQRIDGHFAPPGRPLPSPFRGMCHQMALELAFDRIEPDRPLVLVLTGWLQYGDASTNIALSQSSRWTILPPTLEAMTDYGQWVPIDAVVGMPAGKTKTILVDLAGKLPHATQLLRLNTTFEIRWDRIGLFERITLPEDSVTIVSPTQAELRWRGFSEIKQRHPGGPSTPDYDRVFDRPPWRTALQGWCTRYGDVLELIDRRDDVIAVINGGDAVEISFDAAKLTEQQPKSSRTFFLLSVGWEKDGDHNVTAGHTVDPWPMPTTDWPEGVNDNALEADDVDASTDWRIRYNTRWVPWDRFIDSETANVAPPLSPPE